MAYPDWHCYRIAVNPINDNQWEWIIMLMPEGSIVARNEFRGYKLSGLEAFLAAEIYMRSYLPPAGEPVKPRAPAFGRPLPRRVQEAALQASRLDRAEAVTLGQMVAEVRQAGDTVSAATGLHSRYDAAK